ncbi:hypothetical protein DFH09DRAFT_1086733 [Mycena vulgaris]|nr:hypothetical protein DFH09DRAFT_1086733 [Mycena vulgaris]
MPRLTTLNIQNNRLERLPRAFPRHLLNLNISNNKFDVFPLAVTELTHLSRLDISFNSISELPQEIGRLTCLTKLVIVGSQISALPEEFGSLALLQELDCRRNGIADLAVACGLPELTSLRADHNNLHTLVLSLGPRLKGLDVSHNDITELVIGPRVSTTPPFALTCLDISNAKLSVLDDYTLAQLLSLRHLKLDRNSFRTLPESLGDLMWLETLSCADNAVSELPDSVGRLQKLESLDLHSNSLTALPMSLWNCASLSRLNVTSNLLVVLPSPTFASSRRPSVSRGPDIPPLAHSLEMLYMANNSLTDKMLHPLMILKELRVLNLSLNDIQELPPNFFRDLTQLEEVFLSGNRLMYIPSEECRHLPHELGKVKSLTLLDVGNNPLKYNINNLDYDWNWNFNKNLVFLNLSGNKKLQIKSDVYGRPSISSINRKSIASFSGLAHLRVLGLMDVTITNTGTSSGSDIPDESDDRRVRTSSSLVNGLSYGIADTLGKDRHPHMMDLVHEFRGINKDTVFAMFGRSHPANQAVATTANGLAKYLKDNFIRVFISQLNSLDRQRAEGVPDALRRSFLKLNQDYHDVDGTTPFNKPPQDVWRGHLDAVPVCLKVLRYHMTMQEQEYQNLIKESIDDRIFEPTFTLISPWMENRSLITFLDSHPGFDRLRAANVLVTEDHRCCLADFGLSAIVQMTVTSIRKAGAEAWTAPEVLDDAETTPVPARDIYAFGCTLFQIFTGNNPFQAPPFKGCATWQMPQKVMGGIRPARPIPDSTSPEITDAIWALIESCWAHEPTKRPSSRQILQEVGIPPPPNYTILRRPDPKLTLDGLRDKLRNDREYLRRLLPEGQEQPSEAFRTTLTEELQLNALHLKLDDCDLATALISDIRRPLSSIVDGSPPEILLEGKHRYLSRILSLSIDQQAPRKSFLDTIHKELVGLIPTMAQ